jgi:aspartate carbamoyltransferase catalytic subunit
VSEIEFVLFQLDHRRKVMDLQDVKFDGWPHILRSQQFDKKYAENVFIPLSNRMEKMLAAGSCRHLLDGKEMISLFTAESTRTRASEEMAMQRLGGRVIFSAPGAKFSSAMGKGEPFGDTVWALNEIGVGADVMAVRNDDRKEIPIARLATFSQIPIINAGDGAGKDKQHPTQALLDLYTIYKYCESIDGISVAMIGDLKNGRTVRSLCYLLAKWRIRIIYLVSPPDFRIGNDIKRYLTRHGVEFSECTDIREIAGQADVFYQTRTQDNLGSKQWDRTDEKNGLTIIDRRVCRMMKKDAIIMHPLPCRGEIVRSEVDHDTRAVYREGRRGKPSQMRCGLITRMAEVLIVVSPEISYSLL